jgi:CubicO group peptidase (beta-lactamase class C family)
MADVHPGKYHAPFRDDHKHHHRRPSPGAWCFTRLCDYGEEPTFAASGNGGVWSSVEELAKYERALRNATFLKPATITDSRTVKTFSNWSSVSKPNIGWSWFIGQTTDSLITVGHTGSQGGYLANYVTLPEKNIFFVILCNTPRDVDGYTERILKWLSKR